MGRIDEALRRAGDTAYSDAPATSGANDVFMSPWSFPDPDAATTPAQPAIPSPSVAAEAATATGRLAVFRGFDPALQGRIVAAGRRHRRCSSSSSAAWRRRCTTRSSSRASRWSMVTSATRATARR